MEQIKENRPVAIQLSGIKKRYRLGQIGGGTLQADLESWWARKRGKEDPNTKIGQKERLVGQSFMALNGIDLTIYQGEALGIIGSNGAGKSTLLKLLSRVTAPTEGDIDLYGRVASMLEVGTGFNREMTGRENVYMNGAILGMTKVEIDAKMEDIIDFSEVREFIDTPVKRYSSGMYVKLAFSVAAHLDSEIMIMDEVLAVGDVAFQKKCLDKMREAAKKEGRTVLYVSHNMNTIRQLCDRCIVLDKGQIIFDGDVENAIETYLGVNNTSNAVVDLKNAAREGNVKNSPAKMTSLSVDTENSAFETGSKLEADLFVKSDQAYHDVILKVFFRHDEQAITTMESKPVIHLINGENKIHMTLDLDRLAPARYTLKLVLCLRNEMGGVQYLDVINDSYLFDIIESENFQSNQKWSLKYNGFLIGKPIDIQQG
ncbi:MAG: polysaccharide ABC transporter ATP-binding protein [Erysipelotrichaceae bacterium]|nr:polysaccharide ABC transporter ATP-binding protein [Erysipelotrichaceae bacterium]